MSTRVRICDCNSNPHATTCPLHRQALQAPREEGGGGDLHDRLIRFRDLIPEIDVEDFDSILEDLAASKSPTPVDRGLRERVTELRDEYWSLGAGGHTTAGIYENIGHALAEALTATQENHSLDQYDGPATTINISCCSKCGMWAEGVEYGCEDEDCGGDIVWVEYVPTRVVDGPIRRTKQRQPGWPNHAGFMPLVSAARKVVRGEQPIAALENALAIVDDESAAATQSPDREHLTWTICDHLTAWGFDEAAARVRQQFPASPPPSQSPDPDQPCDCGDTGRKFVPVSNAGNKKPDGSLLQPGDIGYVNGDGEMEVECDCARSDPDQQGAGPYYNQEFLYAAQDDGPYFTQTAETTGDELWVGGPTVSTLMQPGDAGSLAFQLNAAFAAGRATQGQSVSDGAWVEHLRLFQSGQIDSEEFIGALEECADARANPTQGPEAV